jgi:hypothetical protein
MGEVMQYRVEFSNGVIECLFGQLARLLWVAQNFIYAQAKRKSRTHRRIDIGSHMQTNKLTVED